MMNDIKHYNIMKTKAQTAIKINTAKLLLQKGEMLLNIANQIEETEKELYELKNNPPNYYKTFGSEAELQKDIERKKEEIKYYEEMYNKSYQI